MKKFSVPALVLGLSLVGALVVSSEAIAQQVQAQPAPTATLKPGGAASNLKLTMVRGTVNIPASVRTGQFASLQCNQFSGYASSKAQTSCDGNSGFCVPQPKWTRHGQMSGNISEGHCNYAIIVPASHAFAVNGTTDYNPCGGSGMTDVDTSGTGGWMSVPAGETKTNNFNITSLKAACIN